MVECNSSKPSAALTPTPAESAPADNLSSVTDNAACVQRNADGDTQANGSLSEPSIVEGNIKLGSNSEASAPSGDTVEPAAWTTVAQLEAIREWPKHAHSVWGAQNGKIDQALYSASTIEALRRDLDKLCELYAGATVSRQRAEARLAELGASLAQERKRTEKAIKRLRPFADAVFNDNGDMTISPMHDSQDHINAYFVVKEADAARAARGEQP